MNDSSSPNWQTTLWLGDRSPEPVTFVGQSQEAVKTAVTAWVKEQKPKRFANAVGESAAQLCYFYSDGWLELRVNADGGRQILPTGWHCKTSWSKWEQPRYLGSRGAMLTHLLENGLLIEPTK